MELGAQEARTAVVVGFLSLESRRRRVPAVMGLAVQATPGAVPDQVAAQREEIWPRDR